MGAQCSQASEGREFSEGVLLLIFFSFPNYASRCLALVPDVFKPAHSSLSITHKDTVTPCEYGDNNSLHFYSHFNVKTLSALGSTKAGDFLIFPTFYLFFSYCLSHLSSILLCLDEVNTRES